MIYLEGHLWDDAFQLATTMSETNVAMQTFRTYALEGNNIERQDMNIHTFPHYEIYIKKKCLF